MYSLSPLLPRRCRVRCSVGRHQAINTCRFAPKGRFLRSNLVEWDTLGTTGVSVRAPWGMRCGEGGGFRLFARRGSLGAAGKATGKGGLPVKITELLRPEGVALGMQASTRDDVIDQLAELQVAGGAVTDAAGYTEAVLERESTFSTAVGEGIAIPHAKTAAAERPGLVVATLEQGVDWNAPDGKPADLVFLIAAPATEANVHLEVLAKLSALLMHPAFAAALRSASSVEEFLGVVDAAESAYDEGRSVDVGAQGMPSGAAEKAERVEGAADMPSLPQVLAVTACPTGIAHTYMAAENLEKVAERMGVRIKVETQGSVGTKNALEPEEISACEGVIVAADKAVEMARFDGKHLVKVGVAAGISDAERLITEALSGEAPIYHAAAVSGGSSSDSAASEAPSEEQGRAGSETPAASQKRAWGADAYRHLMNGVSHMLPFLVAGGVCMALVRLVEPAVSTELPWDWSTPALVLYLAASFAKDLALPVLAGFIALSIADRPALLPGIAGGWIAAQGYCLDTFASMGAGGMAMAPSGFIGAVVAGFAAGGIVWALERVCRHLPDAVEGIKPMLVYPVVSLVAVTASMVLANPILGVASWWVDTLLGAASMPALALLGAVLGAMMAVDLGGPCNKAAYVFGALLLTCNMEAGETIMASVMAGGMVPPLALALSTAVCKRLWSEDERTAGRGCVLKGLSFVSEAALPFAMAHPARVRPAIVAGAALAAGVSAMLGCTCPAPHGGIWIIYAIGNPLGFVVALAVGTVAGAVLMALLGRSDSKAPADA